MKRMLPSVLLGLGIVLVAVPFLLSRALPAASEAKTPAVPSGAEEPTASQTFVNGFNIPSAAPCNFADVYAGAHDLTGPPIASFTGRSQDFLYVRLLCAPLDPTKSVVYANLGLEALRASGRLPEPEAQQHPLVRQYFQESLATGLDPSFYGRVISKPVCKDGFCRQYTDRTLLLIDERAKEVRWAPLGCMLNRACAKLQHDAQEPPVSQSLPVLLLTCAGAFLLLAGGFLVARRFFQS